MTTLYFKCGCGSNVRSDDDDGLAAETDSERLRRRPLAPVRQDLSKVAPTGGAQDFSPKEETFMAKKFVKCDCGFVMRSDNDDSLVAEVQLHASQEHKMTLSREQVLAMAEPDPRGAMAGASPRS